MGRYIPFLACVLLACAVQAQTHRVGGMGGCNNAVKHTPQADVNYQSGVDVHGWALVPPNAEAPALSAEDFQEVEIELDVPVKPYLGQHKPAVDLSHADINAGTVTIQQDGTARLNGKRLDGYAQQECE